MFKIRPDVVINCIGVLIQGSSASPSNAIFINSFLPHWIVKILDEIGGKLIHVSTDCVFSGAKGFYVESDFRDADDIYGRSKALGEIKSDRHLTIRTSIIGPELKENGEGLLNWFMKQRGTINGYTNAFWGGVSTLELSKFILFILDANLSGLIHLTNGTRISKFDLLKLFQNVFGDLQIIVTPYDGKVIDKSLKSERSDFSYAVSSYEDMIGELGLWMMDNKHLYKYSLNDK